MPRETMTVSQRLSLLLAVGVLPSHGALATEQHAEKSQYSLFNPRPPSLMRELEPEAHSRSMQGILFNYAIETLSG